MMPVMNDANYYFPLKMMSLRKILGIDFNVK